MVFKLKNKNLYIVGTPLFAICRKGKYIADFLCQRKVVAEKKVSTKQK
jgi:hypothetical protein